MTYAAESRKNLDRITSAMNALGYPPAVAGGNVTTEMAKIADALEDILRNHRRPKVYAVNERTVDEEQGIDVVHMHMLFESERLAAAYKATLTHDPARSQIFIEPINVVIANKDAPT